MDTNIDVNHERHEIHEKDPGPRMDTNGYEWIRMDTNGYEWIRMDTNGYEWTRMDTNIEVNHERHEIHE